MPRSRTPTVGRMPPEDPRTENFGAKQQKGRAWTRQVTPPGDVIFNAFEDTFLSSIELDNGEESTNTQTVTSKNGGLVITSVERGVFVDALTTAGALVPHFLTTDVDLSDWQVLGPFKSILSSTDGSSGAVITDDTESDRITVRNISAGTVTVYFLTKVRYLIRAGE